MRTAGSQVERSSLCGAVGCRGLCSLKRFSLPEIYVSMNSPRYAFDINFPPLLQIEFAGQADTGHTDRQTDRQADQHTEGQTYRETVWQPVSRSASQPVGSCRRHLARNFYSPLGLIWSRSAADSPSPRPRSTLSEYLLCFIFCALLLFSLYIHLYDFHRLSPYGLKVCDSRSHACIPCNEGESWK